MDLPELQLAGWPQEVDQLTLNGCAELLACIMRVLVQLIIHSSLFWLFFFGFLLNC